MNKLKRRHDYIIAEPMNGPGQHSGLLICNVFYDRYNIRMVNERIQLQGKKHFLQNQICSVKEEK
ncbi:MAG: hypothetical protein SPF01_02840 [Blautia sp.]|nr:hypothetical protein [Blautia sp.]